MPGLANDLNISEAGYVTHDGAGVFHGRTFQAGAGISISNASGVGGNTTISLSGGLASIETIQGDSGSVAGNTVSFKSNTSNGQGGATVTFSASTATEMNLKTTDVNLNTLVGYLSGNASLATAGAANHGFGYSTLNALTTGTFNTALGYSCLSHLTTGQRNVAVGHSALATGTQFTNNTCVGYSSGTGLVTAGIQNTAIGSNTLGTISTGHDNIAVGFNSGVSLLTSDSSNILIGNSGTSGDNHTVRIGTQGSGDGQVNTCFISGIVGVTVSNTQAVTINSSTGQLGISTSPFGTTWSVITADQSAVVGNGYICNKGSALVLTLPATSSIGDIIEVTGINTALGIKISQNANQQIFLGTSSTTVGATGFLQSTNIRDSLKMVCVVSGASSVYNVISSIGNWTVS